MESPCHLRTFNEMTTTYPRPFSSQLTDDSSEYTRPFPCQLTDDSSEYPWPFPYQLTDDSSEYIHGRFLVSSLTIVPEYPLPFPYQLTDDNPGLDSNGPVLTKPEASQMPSCVATETAGLNLKPPPT